MHERERVRKRARKYRHREEKGVLSLSHRVRIETRIDWLLYYRERLLRLSHTLVEFNALACLRCDVLTYIH